VRVFLAHLLSLLLLAGCAGSVGPVVWKSPGLEQVWPPPPASPRIALLRVVTDVQSLGAEGQGGRFMDWLTGEGEEDVPLVSPYAVAADAQGSIWVTDGGQPGIHVIDLSRRKVSVWSSAGKEPLQLPLGIAYDKLHERIYVSDALAARVYALDRDGDLVEGWHPAVTFQRPVGLAVSSDGKVFVVDSQAGEVIVLMPNGELFSRLHSDASSGGWMNRPTNVAVDNQGHVFVVDSLGFRVLVFSEQGDVLGVIGSLGDGPGRFARPRGIAVDSQGHVYVSDAAFDNIQIFDMAGNTLLFFGSAGSEPGFFNLPAGLSFDDQDRLYAVDAHNRRIQIFQYVAAP